MGANEPPLCKICQPPRRHWKGERHWFDEAGKVTPQQFKAPRKTSKSKPAAKSKDAVAVTPEAKFDRNAYQREYMRKWRAKKPKGAPKCT